MSETGWRAFLADAGAEEWAVLHGGPTAVFRTSSLADAAALAHMRPGALLINAARGGLVDEGALAEYLADNPGAARDAQHLRSLIRNAREERARGKAPRHFRELFRELRRIADAGPGEH